MRTVAAVFTAQSIVESTKQLFAALVPDCRVISIIEDALIQDVIRAGRVTPEISRRLVRYYLAAQDTGADLIFNTCSSIGDVAIMARSLVTIPLVKIDDAMAAEAVRTGARVGVLATLQTTLAPTVRLVRAQAEKAGRTVSVVEGLAKGAFEALVAGQAETHDELIASAAERVASQADVIVLAQGSMARMEEALAKRTGKPVLASPRRGVLEVKETLERMAR
ncbi:MAG: Asp/Glu/hydantoin racemase [candidate division NC10 bacterium]|nr:Asp/Glu/hydantoin racemase [candidate division NC10 bacterium]MBS1117077.1 Asp/Glu/hydantoin racemase [candidate division NC10 bacterium]